MSLLRRIMMREMQIKAAKYPITDGTYPLNRYEVYYQVKNGVIYIPNANEARFCLTTPTIPYNTNCVNQESWIAPLGAEILFEIDNTCGLFWYFRTINNTNIYLNDLVGQKYTLTSDVKNIFAIGTAVEGVATLKLYVNRERWI